MLVNNQWDDEKIKEEIKEIDWDKWKWKHNGPKSLGCSKICANREVYSNTGLPQEARKISNKQPNLIPKGAKNK